MMCALNGCFLLDTSIIIAHTTDAYKVRLDKFKRNISENNVSCFVTHSVFQECERKLEEIIDFFGTELRELLEKTVEEARKGKPKGTPIKLTKDDFLVFERGFSRVYGRRIGVAHKTRLVEEWVIDQLETTFSMKDIIDLHDFFLDLTTTLISEIQVIQDKYDVAIGSQSLAEIVPETQAAPIGQKVQDLVQEGIPRSDAIHLSSAKEYERFSKIPVVFVSCDYSHIVSKKHKISRTIGLKCSGPLYAIYHLKNLQTTG